LSLSNKQYSKILDRTGFIAIPRNSSQVRAFIRVSLFNAVDCRSCWICRLVY